MQEKRVLSRCCAVMCFDYVFQRFHAGAAIGLFTATTGLIDIGNPRSAILIFKMFLNFFIAKGVAKTNIHMRIIIKV